MQRGVTKRQISLLKIIYHSLEENGYPPSFENFKEQLNISSNQAIIDHLHSLEQKGFIVREEKSARSIKISPLGYKALKLPSLLPLVGTSYAGAFAQTFEAASWQPLSNHVAKLQEEVYLVKVSGDSMINAGISNGDLLLIKNQSEFTSGDIVLAQSPEGTTVKRFISQDSPPYLYLKPENPKYENILFTPDVDMKGKVIGKYESGFIKPLVQGKIL